MDMDSVCYPKRRESVERRLKLDRNIGYQDFERKVQLWTNTPAEDSSSFNDYTTISLDEKREAFRATIHDGTW
jgi:hypothetical protein